MKLLCVSLLVCVFGIASSAALQCYKCEETAVGGSVQSDDDCDRESWIQVTCLPEQVCIFSNMTANGVTRTTRRCARPNYCEDTLSELKRMTQDFEHDCRQCGSDFCNDQFPDYLVIGLSIAVVVVLLVLLILIGYFIVVLLRKLYLN